MRNDIYKKLDEALNNSGVPWKQLEKLYPKIINSLMPLSLTGVTPRTYSHWKKEGLIISTSSVEEERSWVRLNLIEYVWIKIIQVMRDFGVPIEIIKETQQMLFKNILKHILSDKKTLLNYIENEIKGGRNEKDSQKKMIEAITNEVVKSIPKEYEIFSTQIGLMVCDLLVRNNGGSIIITKKEGVFDCDYITPTIVEQSPHKVIPLLELPRLQIPLRKFIDDFFNDPKMEKYVESFELLSLNEKKVIDAIRKKDFKEIVIKLNENDKTMTIEVEKSGAIMDQKAKDVRRILGLNEYSEVTIKYRNDKHLYFKNKTRI